MTFSPANIRDFMKMHYRHFNVATVVDAAQGWVDHLNSNGKMFVTLAGAMSTAELGVSLAEMIRETKEFLTVKGVTPEELERNIAADIGALPGRFETSPAVLGAMQSNALFGRPDNYQETLASIYTAQTPATLDAIARASIDADKFVWVVVGDASVVRAQLEPLGLPIEQREMEGE